MTLEMVSLMNPVTQRVLDSIESFQETEFEDKGNEEEEITEEMASIPEETRLCLTFPFKYEVEAKSGDNLYSSPAVLSGPNTLRSRSVRLFEDSSSKSVKL